MDTIPYFFAILLLAFSFKKYLEIKKYHLFLTQKIILLETQLQIELEQQQQLQQQELKIEPIEKNTQSLFLKIKLAIVNLDFTLQEIL